MMQEKYGTLKSAAEVCGSRQSQTREELEQLHRVIQSTDELIAQVRQRLSGVIMQTPKANNICKDTVEATLVPLAEEIRNDRRKLQSINSDIGELLQEIEL